MTAGQDFSDLDMNVKILFSESTIGLEGFWKSQTLSKIVFRATAVVFVVNNNSFKVSKSTITQTFRREKFGLRHRTRCFRLTSKEHGQYRE